MELRYCEDCGNAYRVELGKPFSLTDRFVCESCTHGGPGSKKAKDKKPGSTRLGDVLQGDSLNLFSQQTIVLHKQKQEAAPGAQKPKSSRLRLVKPGSASVEGAGTGEAQAATTSSASGSVRALSSPNGARSAPVAPAAPGAAVGGGSVAPSKSARKILFRCLHCRSTLSIRPVERTSKLVCPQCSKDIYVTATGKLFKTSPSAAVRKDPAEIPDVAGSVRVAKKGSTVQLRTPTGGSNAPAAAPKAAPGSSRIQPIIPGGSVRLTRVHPGAPASVQKPCSAFEEHQARQDPEKTIFITEEATEDLSDIASSGAMRNVAEKFVKAQSDVMAPPRGPAESLQTDESDLLENETEYVGVPSGPPELLPEAPAIAPLRNDGAPKQEGLTHRVLKALFSP